MNAKTLLAGSAIALALTAAAATPANAVITTFALISVTSMQDFYYKTASSGPAHFYSFTAPSTHAGTALVDFSFVNEGVLDTAVHDVSAILTLSGVTAGVSTLSGGVVTQTFGPTTFSLLSTAPITVGTTTYAAGSNLLSGAFSNAYFSGKSSNASILDDNDASFGDTLTYTSDFVTFQPTAALGLSLSLTSAVPNLNKVGSNLNTFKADLGGQFSADPDPLVNGVPEPASWALMMVGFGLAGASIRRRARVQDAV